MMELGMGPHLNLFFQYFGFIPYVFFQHPWHILPLFTAMFLHGGLMHLFGNMLTLWIFGDNVEDTMGHGRYVIFYFTCGIFASLTHAIFNPSSTLPSIGASGAIAGVMGAYMIYFPHARVLTLVPIFFFLQLMEIPAFLFLGLWFFLQFFSGTLALTSTFYQAGGVAWWAHIGGFVAGIVLGMLFRRRDGRRIIVLY